MRGRGAEGGRNPAVEVLKLSLGNCREKDLLLFTCAGCEPQFLLSTCLTGSPRIEIVCCEALSQKLRANS